MTQGHKGTLTNTTIAATATLVTPEDPSRRTLFLENVDESVTIYFGPSTVTTSDYLFRLAAGKSVSDSDSRDALYGIVASGTAPIKGFVVR